MVSVVHEPSGLEPFEPGGATSRLQSLGNRSLGGSNRGPRADSSLLAARAGSDRGPRADSTLDSSLLAVSWRFLGGSSLARVLESRSGLGSSPGVPRAEPAHEQH